VCGCDEMYKGWVVYYPESHEFEVSSLRSPSSSGQYPGFGGYS
jgi:hypothetical protein